MKRKFTIHFDAILVIAILFVVSIGLNAFLYSQIDELTQENEKLQWQGVADSFNLSSQETYIKKLKQQLKQTKND